MRFTIVWSSHLAEPRRAHRLKGPILGTLLRSHGNLSAWAPMGTHPSSHVAGPRGPPTTGPYFIGFYRFLQVFIGFYRFLQVFIGFYRFFIYFILFLQPKKYNYTYFYIFLIKIYKKINFFTKIHPRTPQTKIKNQKKKSFFFNQIFSHHASVCGFSF